MLKNKASGNRLGALLLVWYLAIWSSASITVAHAENFHGLVHLVAYGGNSYLVCAVCDVSI